MLTAGEPEGKHDEQQVHGLMLKKAHSAGIKQLAEALAEARRGLCFVTRGGYGVHGLLIKKVGIIEVPALQDFDRGLAQAEAVISIGDLLIGGDAVIAEGDARIVKAAVVTPLAAAPDSAVIGVEPRGNDQHGGKGESIAHDRGELFLDALVRNDAPDVSQAEH